MELMQKYNQNLAPLHQDIVERGILVVEDSNLQRSVMLEMLKRLGVNHLYEATSGLDALNQLHKNSLKPAIILADLQMPGMDGIELIQHLADEFADIALIVVSGVDLKLLNTIGSMVDACNMTLLGAFAKPMHANDLQQSLLAYQPSSKLGKTLQAPDQIHPRDLKQAIRQGHILPWYQPKICIKRRAVVGFEALARWRDPIRGIIPPVHFIDLATEHDLLKELTCDMLDVILADLKAWNQVGLFPDISINLSVALLEDKTFANHIIRAVTYANIDPRKIMLEITESALMKDRAAALATIGRLKLKGFGFSIDDYGTGFSSLQQLSRIAFNELKIDKSFVSNAANNPHMTQLLQSAIDVGRRLGLTTVAEGVETIEQVNLLKQLGCDQLQGYLFAKPMPVGDVFPWLEDNAIRVDQLCK